MLHYLGLIKENKDNPKNMWRAISKVLDKDLNSTETTCVDVAGRIITKRDIAQALNHHFTTVGTKLSSTTECKPGDDPVKQLMEQTNTVLLRYYKFQSH